MSIFGQLGVATSGLHVYRTWLDAVSDNIANINTARRTSEPAFQARYVVAEAVEDGGTGQGARVAGIAAGSAEGRLQYEPDNPLADAQGMVRYADVDLAQQMTNLILAQRGYQANLGVIQRAKDAYQAALSLGK